MSSTRWAVLLMLAISMSVGSRAQSATDSTDAPPDTLQVGETGLALYPRWNKLFKPLAQLSPGTTVDVLRSRGGWSQVEVLSVPETPAPTDGVGGAKGWIFYETRTRSARTAASGLQLPLAASPTTSGLVTKGWSPGVYARAHNVDPVLIDAVLDHYVDVRAYEAFLQEDPPPLRDDAPMAAEPEVTDEVEEGDVPPWEADRGAALDRLDDAMGGSGDASATSLARKSAELGAGDPLEPAGLASFTEQDELALGTAVAMRVLGSEPLWAESSADYVRFVGLRLVEALPAHRSHWRFLVLDRDDVNAFSLPGGYVFVTRGALEQCGNEAQLAALLAHEVAHVQLSHALRTLGEARLQVMLDRTRSELDELVGGVDPVVEQLTGLSDELFSATLQPFHHALETEADRMGVRIMLLAGYDAREAVHLLHTLAADDPASGAPGMPSHPSSVERIDAVQDELAGHDVLGSIGEARYRAWRDEMRMAPAGAPAREATDADG